MTAANTPSVCVLLFGDRPVAPALAGLPVRAIDDHRQVDDAAREHRRLIVAGRDADLAAVLTRLLRSAMLDVEIGFASARRSAATRAYRLPAGRRGARRAVHGSVRRVPLVRDDTGTAIVGGATWRGADAALYGEAVVDDTVLFDGDVAGVRITPTPTQPGVRASVLTGRGRPRQWVHGRAAQLGTTGARVYRDGVWAERPVRRSTFYRHTKGWLLVG